MRTVLKRRKISVSRRLCPCIENCGGSISKFSIDQLGALFNAVWVVDDDIEYLETSNIMHTGRRTRGVKIDFSNVPQEGPDDEDDEENIARGGGEDDAVEEELDDDEDDEVDEDDLGEDDDDEEGDEGEEVEDEEEEEEEE